MMNVLLKMEGFTLLLVKEHKALLGIILLALLVLTFPIFIRSNNFDGALIGSESYYSLRISETMIKEGYFFGKDDLSFGGRAFVGERLWFYLLSFNPNFLARYLPLFLGLLSILISYFLLYKLDKKIVLPTCLVFILSPPFLYLFSSATKYSAAIFFFLLTLYLLILKKNKFAYFILILTGFFSVVFSLFLLILFKYYFFKNENKKSFLILILILILQIILQYYNIFSNFGFYFINFSINNLASVLFSYFSMIFGMSLFTFFVFCVGVYFKWVEKYRFILVYLLVVGLFILSFYFHPLIFLLNLAFSLLAAYGFIYLLSIKWKFEDFRYLVLLILVCGILFSFVSFTDRFVNSEPSLPKLKVIDFLAKNVAVKEVVFTDFDNGVFVDYEGKKSFVGPNIHFYKDINQRIGDFHRVIDGKRIGEIQPLIENYNIKFVVIDSKMYDKYWDSRDVNLIFLLKFGTHFSKVYDDGDTQIWKYISS